MFLALLLVTLATAVIVSYSTARLFEGSINAILARIVAEDIAYAWARFLRFAIYVVGISGGVRIYQLEEYVRMPVGEYVPPVLSGDRWVLEVYRTIIESLQAIAWMLLIFFVFALIAYVIVRAFELRAKRAQSVDKQSS